MDIHYRLNLILHSTPRGRLPRKSKAVKGAVIEHHVIPMTVRPFPETRVEPRKRILLVPVLLILIGMFLIYMHPWLSTGFFGVIIALTGALSGFLVGFVFADLWAAARRSKGLAKAREAKGLEVREGNPTFDPFEDELETDRE